MFQEIENLYKQVFVETVEELLKMIKSLRELYYNRCNVVLGDGNCRIEIYHSYVNSVNIFYRGKGDYCHRLEQIAKMAEPIKDELDSILGVTFDVDEEREKRIRIVCDDGMYGVKYLVGWATPDMIQKLAEVFFLLMETLDEIIREATIKKLEAIKSELEKLVPRAKEVQRRLKNTQVMLEMLREANT